MARDFRAEYERRIQQWLARGFSRSVARGHPRWGELKVQTGYDPTLEKLVKDLRGGRPLTEAARTRHIAPERARRYVEQTGVAHKDGGRWRSSRDDRPREIVIWTEGAELTIRVSGDDEARKWGRWRNAVNRFLDDNNTRHLDQVRGMTLWDRSGRLHPLETRPNVLYRLDAAGRGNFEQIYRIVS